MTRKIKPENLSAEINNQIQGWSKELREEFGKIAENKGKELARTLRRNSPKRTGKYARSWTSTITENSTLRFFATVHNKSHYQLIHLLEKPHQKRNGGRTKPQVHVQPARDKIEREFVEDIEKLIKT